MLFKHQPKERWGSYANIKVEFKTRSIFRDKASHFIIKNRSTQLLKRQQLPNMPQEEKEKPK